MSVYWAEIADQNQTEKQLQFIKNAVKPDGLVLDLACGTGRHLIPLCKEGYGMVGLDISTNLLRIAKDRWSHAEVVQADMRFLPFKPEAFSAVVSMDTSFSYLPQRKMTCKVSIKCGRYWQEWVLVVDVFNREHLINRGRASSQPKCWEYSRFFLLQKRTVTADGGFLCDLWTVRDKADGQVRVFKHVARLYALSQLQGLLENAGFKIKAVYGDYSEQSFSPDCSRLILVAGVN